jgi:hypothetical protein
MIGLAIARSKNRLPPTTRPTPARRPSHNSMLNEETERSSRLPRTRQPYTAATQIASAEPVRNIFSFESLSPMTFWVNVSLTDRRSVDTDQAEDRDRREMDDPRQRL